MIFTKTNYEKIFFNFVVSKFCNLLKKIDEFSLNFLKFQKDCCQWWKLTPQKSWYLLRQQWFIINMELCVFIIYLINTCNICIINIFNFQDLITIFGSMLSCYLTKDFYFLKQKTTHHIMTLPLMASSK